MITSDDDGHGLDPAAVYPAAGANGHHVPTDIFAIHPDRGSIFVYDDGRAVFRPQYSPGRVVVTCPSEPAIVITSQAPTVDGWIAA